VRRRRADPRLRRCTERAGADQAAVRLARTEIRELLSGWWSNRCIDSHHTRHGALLPTGKPSSVRFGFGLAERSTVGIDEPARLARRHCYYYRDKILRGQAEWFVRRTAAADVGNGGWSTPGAPSTAVCKRGKPLWAANLCWLMWLRAPYFLVRCRDPRAASSGLWRPCQHRIPAK